MDRDLYPVQPLHLLPDVALPEGHADHRRLDVGVPHRLHDCEGIGPRCVDLGSERAAHMRVAHFGPKSTEAYGNLPKSTESVIMARSQLLDKKKDSRLL